MTAGFAVLAVLAILCVIGWLIRSRRARFVAARRPQVLKAALARAREK